MLRPKQAGLALCPADYLEQQISRFRLNTTRFRIPISIVFGSSVSGAEGSTSNDVEASLAYNTVDQRDCPVLGPRLGKRLNAIFREASAQ